MDFPVYLRLGPLNLHPHFVFEALAYTIAYSVYVPIRKRKGDPIESASRWWVIATAAVGAAVGSKALYWIEDPQQTLRRWNDFSY
jgi:phosphatidylglycerol:prolipoprotein diacylglycerol transferase